MKVLEWLHRGQDHFIQAPHRLLPSGLCDVASLPSGSYYWGLADLAFLNSSTPSAWSYQQCSHQSALVTSSNNQEKLVLYNSALFVSLTIVWDCDGLKAECWKQLKVYLSIFAFVYGFYIKQFLKRKGKHKCRCVNYWIHFSHANENMCTNTLCKVTNLFNTIAIILKYEAF